jgi:DNA-binding NarL/FixJ family response regulator
LLEHDENIRVVGQASNGEEVLELLDTVEVDIVLLDLEMQPLDGLSTVRRIKADGLSVKTIVLTLHRDATLMRTLIEEGVHGYILKDARAQEVIDAVKLVYEGQGYVSATASGLLMEVVKDGEAGKIGEKLGELTPSATRILRKIATDMTSKEIAAELGLSTRTVENHRARICKKMNLSGVHSLVKFAFDNRDRL